MPHQVIVTLRSAANERGPEGSEQEAQRDLEAIRPTLGTDDVPDVSWLAVKGADILSARIVDVPDERRGAIPWGG